MISKTLHVVWVGPHNPPDQLIDSWRAKHSSPEWEHVLWRDHKTGWNNAEQIRIRASRREWNGVADVIRWEILARFGGIVVDADSECLQPLDERFLEPDAWSCYENEAVRPGVIACGAMGGVQGAPIFKACVEACATADPNVPAWKVVGPLLITRIAGEMPGALKVFPARHFNPEHHSGAKAPGEDPIFARQFWGGTKGYNVLRKWPCQCPECYVTALRPPWG